MKKKTGIVVSSVAAIAVCLSVIAGSTFALFTSESTVNVAITSANVDVTAKLVEDSVVITSGEWDEETKSYISVVQDGEYFANGGQVFFDANGISIDGITPMDGVSFELAIENNSSINVKYRTAIELTGDKALAEALTLTLNGEAYDGATIRSAWTELAPKVNPENIEIGVYLDENADNSVMGMELSLTYRVEAVQANAYVIDETDVEADLYIYNKADLIAFANSVNGGDTFAGKTVVLMSDIDLCNEEWTPIATGAGTNANNKSSFNGTFDGMGMTVSNLKITEGTYYSTGLFGYVSGTVKNFNLKNVNISNEGYAEMKANGNYETANGGTGAVVGNIYPSGTVSDINVTNVNIFANHYVGGIVGHGYAKIYNCTVTNGSITAEPETLGGSYDNGDKVGGITGYSAEGSMVIDGCSVTDLTIKAWRDVGGIAGAVYQKNTITNNTVKNVIISYVENEAYTRAHENIGAVIGRYVSTPPAENLVNNTATNVKLTIADGFWIDENGEYCIDSVAGLTYFAADANSGNTYAGKTVNLCANVDLAGINWTPIGSNADKQTVSFAGTFDGNGYTISNLTINQGAGYHAAGFFGTIAKATVQNVNFANASVTNLSQKVNGNTTNGTAVVVGTMIPSGYIYNCNVYGATVNGNCYVGGICGYAYGMVKGCTVEDSTIVCTAEDLENANSYDNGDKVGGIVGYFQANEGGSYGVIDNTAKNVTVQGYRHIGGIAGYAGVTDEKFNGNTAENITIIQDYTHNYKGSNAVEGLWGYVGYISGTLHESNTYTGECAYSSLNKD